MSEQPEPREPMLDQESSDRKKEVVRIIEAAERRAGIGLPDSKLEPTPEPVPVQRSVELDIQAMNMLKALRDMALRIRMGVNTRNPPWTVQGTDYTLRFEYEAFDSRVYRACELKVPFAIVNYPDTWFKVIKDQLLSILNAELNRVFDAMIYPVKTQLRFV